jgi:hypothetical protein
VNKRKKNDDKLYKITRPQAIERDSIDGYPCCVICGTPATEVHHILPRGRGGTSELNNLACLCRYCHENLAHGVFAKETKLKLETIIMERMKQYEKN